MMKPMNLTFTRAMLIAFALLIAVPISAQDGAIAVEPPPTATYTPPDTGVWVTTQDFSSLRTGPSTFFERIAVVDPAVTLPAIGRSADGRWLQVDYNGQQGWIYYALLVWSGDVVQLPIDGLDPNPYVRRLNMVALTTRETPVYRRQVTPSDQIGTIPAGVRVEMTGRLGEGGFYWVQIEYQEQVYWVGSWNLRVISRSPNAQLFDTSYLYNYSRVGAQLETDINASYRALNTINGIWVRLAVGESVSCGSIPTFVQTSSTLQADIASLPVFAPLLNSLNSANGHINTAISLFADACSRTGDQFFITQNEVVTALSEIEIAGRDLVLVGSLLTPLQRRDPVLSIFNN